MLNTHVYGPFSHGFLGFRGTDYCFDLLQVSACDVVFAQPPYLKPCCAFLSRHSPFTNGVYKYFPKAEAGKSFRAFARTLQQLLTKNTISGNVRLISSINEGNINNLNKTANTKFMGHVDRPTCTPACRPLSCCTGPGTS